MKSLWILRRRRAWWNCQPALSWMEIKIAILHLSPIGIVRAAISVMSCGALSPRFELYQAGPLWPYRMKSVSPLRLLTSYSVTQLYQVFMNANGRCGSRQLWKQEKVLLEIWTHTHSRIDTETGWPFSHSFFLWGLLQKRTFESSYWMQKCLSSSGSLLQV